MVKKPRASALYYRKDMEAPIVLGHGEGPWARKAIELAESLGIPVKEDHILSQSLFQVGVGEEVPTDLFEILALVYRALLAEK
ncbi:MAG: EscU/YscU/HrcU family type III secretion system export apparatus switch protein [Spirochaetales bacterium]|nr:EscU/YscU/HrcU family type III secretion system export apparatus switch protein [Spirochaetales bacterium]